VGSWSCRDRNPTLEDRRICRLPEGLRPARSLTFAALSREAPTTLRELGPQKLVSLSVQPDGWVQGEGSLETRCAIDLGAIRFSLSRGMALVDEARLHVATLANGRRFVVLQGSLAPRSFSALAGPVAIAQMPKACRPRPEAFVATGTRPGNFHLLHARVAADGGGELVWCDAKFQCMDEVHVSGVAYEVAPEALLFSLRDHSWTDNRRRIVVRDFQRQMINRCGDLTVAWQRHFDTSRAGLVHRTQFGEGCRASGYRGDVSRLWDMLDADRQGDVTLEEFLADPGEPGAARTTLND